jgi:hypothetical protein
MNSCDIETRKYSLKVIDLDISTCNPCRVMLMYLYLLEPLHHQSLGFVNFQCINMCTQIQRVYKPRRAIVAWYLPHRPYRIDD